jgi:hypothetical protein
LPNGLRSDSEDLGGLSLHLFLMAETKEQRTTIAILKSRQIAAHRHAEYVMSFHKINMNGIRRRSTPPQL